MHPFMSEMLSFNQRNRESCTVHGNQRAVAMSIATLSGSGFAQLPSGLEGLPIGRLDVKSLEIIEFDLC